MTYDALNWLQKIADILPVIAVILFVIAGAVLIAALILKVFNLRHLLTEKSVFIELTPPAKLDKTPEATQRLFSVLHGLKASQTWQEKLLRRQVTFSAEVVSSRELGIRYIFRVPEKDAELFEQTIVSYLPDAQFRRVIDYASDKVANVLEFKQTGHFAYPLQTQGDLWQHDPIAYLAGAMTKLASDDLIAFQLVISPIKLRQAESLAQKLLNNEELVSQLGRRRGIGITSIFSGINSLLFSALEAVGDVNSPRNRVSTAQQDIRRKQEVITKQRPARVLSPLEQKLAESVHHKLNQPTFSVNVRVLVAVSDKQQLKQRTKSIKSSLAAFNVPKYQSLRARSNVFKRLEHNYRSYFFKHRLPSAFQQSTCILAASELADIYHFPFTATQTENMVKSHSRTLAAPLSLKGKGNFDIVLGRNHHHGTTTDIGLTGKERERHVYIIGGTGNGKTTMMLYSMVQSIRNGEGMAFVDPHGDAAETLLGYIPKERINDVVYFNPDDLAHPIGLNLLELTPGLEGDELLREKDLITESVISVFRKIFSDEDSGGHRIEYVLRNSIQTALTIKGATLFTIFNLLNDPRYRKEAIKNLEDKDLKNFWKNELGKAGEFQRVKMSAGITTKIGRFLFSATAKRILEQEKSTINFDEILDGKILICNFSKGLIGEDTSELFGITVLAKLQLAALRRARQKQTERKPFYLYVDEFQNFATTSFVQLLSEARKYKLFLTMAEQSTSQQEDQQMVNIILANVGTVVCFRSGNPADEKLLLPLFKPYIEEGEISNLASFNFYARLSALKPQEPVSGETIVLEDDGSEEVAKKVIAASRKNHAMKSDKAQKKKAAAKKSSPKKAVTEKSEVEVPDE